MSELIPITETDDGIQAVTGRDLHEFLEVKTPYKDWMPRMIEYGFVAGQDFGAKMSESTGGRPKQDHIISLDMAKELSMIQRTEKGKQARQYFIEVEKRAKSAPTLSGKELMAAALVEAQETMRQLEVATQKQESELAEVRPKAEYHDRFISEDSDVLTIDDWAAQYGVKKGAGLALLRDKKIIYRKAVTREISKKKGEQVDRLEHRAYAPYFHMFDLRPQLKTPRYNNGQMRQTLYVRVAFSTQLAKAAGINTAPEGLF